MNKKQKDAFAKLDAMIDKVLAYTPKKKKKKAGAKKKAMRKKK